MSTNARNEPISNDRHRYAELSIGTGEYIIYDRENHRAWIQSTVAVPVSEID